MAKIKYLSSILLKKVLQKSNIYSYTFKKSIAKIKYIRILLKKVWQKSNIYIRILLKKVLQKSK